MGAMPDDDDDYQRGRDSFDRLVRGDAMIGLVADVPAMEREMMDALWAAAARGSIPAFRTLGECYLAALRPIGAFEGIDPSDADGRPWPRDVTAIDDERPSLQAALRAYAAAGRADREALQQFAKLSRSSSADNQRRALAMLSDLPQPSGAELYLRGLVQHWLGELAHSHATHVEAAAAGNADAMFELYVLYTQGLGVEADGTAAQQWLERAAGADHPRALYNLGAAIASASTSAADMAKAASYYERAAQRGNARAAATLGVMILQEEIPGTTDDAIRWLDTADEGGYPSWEMLEAADLDDPREA